MAKIVQEQKIAPGGIKSPTVLSLQVSGWLLFICLWLPLCRGCSGTVETPISALKLDSITTLGDLIAIFILLGSYCNGIFVASLVGLAAWMASEKIWRFFFVSQFAISLLVGVVLVGLMLWNSGSAKEFFETSLCSFPALFGFGIWVGLAIRRNAIPTAWARLQHVWTISALLYVHMLMLFKGSALYGYWLTLIGLLCVVFAVELARHRMQHDLWDAAQRVERPQFSIRSLLIWTAFFPIVFSYYRGDRTIQQLAVQISCSCPCPGRFKKQNRKSEKRVISFYRPKMRESRSLELRLESFDQLVSPFAPRKLRGDRYFCGAKGDTWTFINRTILSSRFLATLLLDASYTILPLKSVRHGEAVPDGFQRRIRFGDLCSCQLPSRWRKANGNDCIRRCCILAFSQKCRIIYQ